MRDATSTPTVPDRTPVPTLGWVGARWQCEHDGVSATAPPLVSLRSVLAALAGGVGAVHLLVAGQRHATWAAEAAVLTALGVIQIALGVAGLVAPPPSTSRTSAGVWWSAIVVSVGAVLAWAWTRTAGYPVGPLEGEVPGVHVLEVCLVAAEIVTIALVAAVLLTDSRLLGPTGLRFENLTAVLVVAAGLPGIAASSWLDDVGTGGSASTHVHMVVGSGASDTMTSADRQALGTEIATARAAALRWPTLADARAAGLLVSGDPTTGVGVQAFDPASSIAPDAFDPAAPRAWIYASDDDDAPVIGVLYDAVGADAPEGFTGDTDGWHLHAGECVVPSPVGDLAVPWDPVITGDDCGRVDGTRNDSLHWMLRAWVVDGWENPVSTFAHEMPLVVVVD